MVTQQQVLLTQNFPGSAEITWPPDRNIEFEGRNGVCMCAGVLVSHYKYDGDIFKLRPLNSKGDWGRACMDIPVEAIPSLIQALQAIYDHVRGMHSSPSSERNDQ